MLRTRSLATLPDNIDAFRDEIAPVLGELYGPEAATEYQKNARRFISASLVHPQVRAIALFDRKTVAGFTLTMLRNGLGEIFFVHLLEPFRNRGLEGRLLRDTIHLLHAEKVQGILCECVVAPGIELESPLVACGLRPVPRQLMASELNGAALRETAPYPVRPLMPPDSASVAQCIVDAYQGQGGEVLHQEVRSLPNALDFLARVQNGAYGTVQPGCQQVLFAGSQCAGAILSCQVAPGTGFVLQLVVAPPFRGKGYGTALLRTLANVYRNAGYKRLALGVTCDNPARQLYEKLGFRVIQPVTSYVWWQEEAHPGLASASGRP